MTERDGGLEFAANVSLLFAELPMLERFSAAAAAGFASVESWWPFGPAAVPPAAQVDAFVGAIEDCGIPQSGMNLFAGDQPAGERGLASDPRRRDEFAAALEVTAGVARRTGCRGFNALYGQRLPGFTPEQQDAVAVENLSAAVRRLGDLGGTVFVEPLARGLNGAYPIETAAQAVAVVERVREATGRDEIGILFDTFHLAANGEDLDAVIDRDLDWIAHVQVADSPGRGEPGTGTVDVAGVIGRLWDRGYRAVVAAEYVPTMATAASLGWVAGVPELHLAGHAG